MWPVLWCRRTSVTVDRHSPEVASAVTTADRHSSQAASAVATADRHQDLAPVLSQACDNWLLPYCDSGLLPYHPNHAISHSLTTDFSLRSSEPSQPHGGRHKGAAVEMCVSPLGSRRRPVANAAAPGADKNETPLHYTDFENVNVRRVS